MDPSVILATASIAKAQLTGWTPWEFSWGPIDRGGRTMAEGAKWTLFPDGTAAFDATVTGGHGSAGWTIWHVDLLDADGAILGSLATEHPVEGDWRKFVLTMPGGGAERHRVRAWASFDVGLWDDIARLRMHSSW